MCPARHCCLANFRQRDNRARFAAFSPTGRRIWRNDMQVNSYVVRRVVMDLTDGEDIRVSVKRYFLIHLSGVRLRPIFSARRADLFCKFNAPRGRVELARFVVSLRPRWGRWDLALAGGRIRSSARGRYRAGRKHGPATPSTVVLIGGSGRHVVGSVRVAREAFIHALSLVVGCTAEGVVILMASLRRAVQRVCVLSVRGRILVRRASPIRYQASGRVRDSQGRFCPI